MHIFDENFIQFIQAKLLKSQENICKTKCDKLSVIESIKFKYISIYLNLMDSISQLWDE